MIVKMLLHFNSGSNNGMWKGNDLKYEGQHYRMKQLVKKPLLCEMCKEKEPLDLANISGKYLYDVNDWQWLCRKCHMLSDGRIKNLSQYTSNHSQNIKKMWDKRKVV
jgi:hypothetical protein